MENKRPLSILRFNAEKMRDNGAPQEYIAKYLADNGSNFQQIMSIESPSQDILNQDIELERSGKWKKQQEMSDVGSLVGGTAKAVAGGLTYGFADELRAGAKAISETALKGGFKRSNKPFVEQIKERRNLINTEYDKAFEEEKANMERFAEKHPVLSTVGTVAGALANPLGAVGMAGKGASLGTKVARGALTSGVQGGLYGLGEGEGGLANRLSNALDYAKTGAIVGGGIPVAGWGLKKAGELTADVLGLTSGAGGESIKRAYTAGKQNSQTFKQAMRGKTDAFKAVEEAGEALKNMEYARGQAFASKLPKNGEIAISNKGVVQAYDDAVKKISGVTSGVNDVATKQLSDVRKMLQNIDDLGGFTFNRANEMKQELDDMIGKMVQAKEKKVVSMLMPIKNAIKDAMVEKVPEYGRALKEFSEATELIESIKSALSSKSSPTTQLRALQSITRQSVAGAQGGKIQLGKILDEVSGGRLLDTVAGGQVSQWMPRDILRGGAGVMSALKLDPRGIAGALALSPRAVGESAYLLGRLANQAGKATARMPKSATVYTPLVKALGGM